MYCSYAPMKKRTFEEFAAQSYIAPVARIVSAQFQGLICNSIQSVGIDDLEEDDDKDNLNV